MKKKSTKSSNHQIELERSGFYLIIASLIAAIIPNLFFLETITNKHLGLMTPGVAFFGIMALAPCFVLCVAIYSFFVIKFKLVRLSPIRVFLTYHFLGTALLWLSIFLTWY